MFADELARAIERAPRAEVPELSRLLWKAYAAGQITEEAAQSLSEALEARKAIPARPAPAQRPRCGSRPRTSDSMHRRRRWAASGRLPPALAAGFTLAEQAVLAVLAGEVACKGDCRLAVGHLAALAGVSPSTVRNALREARALGLLEVEERRVSAWRNDTNVVRIASPEWRTWLRLRGSGGGCKTMKPTITNTYKASYRAPAPTIERAAGKETGGTGALKRAPERRKSLGRGEGFPSV